MKVTIETEHEIREVKFAFGSIRSNGAGTVLNIVTPQYEITFHKNKVYLTWIVHRPTHDHNSRPHLVFELPESGRVVEGGKNAEIHLFPQNFPPDFFIHSLGVEKINLWNMEKTECYYRNGKWKTMEEINQLSEEKQ